MNLNRPLNPYSRFYLYNGQNVADITLKKKKNAYKHTKIASNGKLVCLTLILNRN